MDSMKWPIIGIVLSVVLLVVVIVCYRKSERIQEEYNLGYISSALAIDGLMQALPLLAVYIIKLEIDSSVMTQYRIRVVIGIVAFLYCYFNVPREKRKLYKVIPAVVVMGLAFVIVALGWFAHLFGASNTGETSKSDGTNTNSNENVTPTRGWAERYSDREEVWVFKRVSWEDGSSAYLENELDMSREVEVFKYSNFNIDGIVYDKNGKAYYPCS